MPSTPEDQPELIPGMVRSSVKQAQAKARATRERKAAGATITDVDPVARVLLRGVRTRGSAGNGRREFYAATDHRAVVSASGTLDGAPLGALAPVSPEPGFGFSSTPPRPSVTSLVTTVDLPA